MAQPDAIPPFLSLLLHPLLPWPLPLLSLMQVVRSASQSPSSIFPTLSSPHPVSFFLSLSFTCLLSLSKTLFLSLQLNLAHARSTSFSHRFIAHASRTCSDGTKTPVGGSLLGGGPNDVVARWLTSTVVAVGSSEAQCSPTNFDGQIGC